jgi:hypothetical protein
VAVFAEIVLQLAERQDELAVAKNDLERAIAEESIIITSDFCFEIFHYMQS